MALSQQELDNLAAMPREELERLLVLIREALILYGQKGCVPQSAIDDLVKAVPDKLCQEIVHDLRGGRAEPGWLKAPAAKGPEERRGPVKAIPLEGRRDIRWIDQMCDVQDAIDKAERAKGLGAVFGQGPKVLTKEDGK